MNKSEALTLQHYFDAGYTIKIEAGRYETGFVSEMGLEDYDEEEDDETNPRTFKDEFREGNLCDIDISEVTVFKKVDWTDDSLSQPEELDDNERYNP